VSRDLRRLIMSLVYVGGVDTFSFSSESVFETGDDLDFMCSVLFEDV
jgi:hypothetical protein